MKIKKNKNCFTTSPSFLRYCQTSTTFNEFSFFELFSPTNTYYRQLCSFPSRLIKNEVLGKPENEIKMTFSQNCV